MSYELPTEFDLIVIGTGIIESIISAAASRIGKRVLHLDCNNYYGGSWASFNLDDLMNIDKLTNIEKEEYNEDNIKETILKLNKIQPVLPHFEYKWNIPHNDENNVPDDESSKIKENILSREFLQKNSRKFVIDLIPKLQYARGEMVELLISSNIARYSEFRNVSRVLTYLNGNLEIVPCSRSDVFANNKVSVIEKRMLMKVLTSLEAEESTEYDPTSTFKDYLKSKKLSNNLIHYVLYALSMSNDKTSSENGIKNTKRFLKSLGRFGKTPFLFSMYGSGELTQAYCRLSAVFGGIFALNQNIPSILLNDDKFTSIICGKQKISAEHLVMDFRMAPDLQKVKPLKYISRGVFITNKSVMEDEKEHLTLLLHPSDGEKLCVVLELGFLTGTCPKEYYLVHMIMEGTGCPKKDLEKCADDLFDFQNHNSNKPFVCWYSYFSLIDNTNIETNNISKNIYLCSGPDLDLDYDNSVKKAKEIFNQLYPDLEFLPRAPDADEIVIGDDLELASEPTEETKEKDSSGANIDECIEAKEL